ncbi:MAG: methyltransferase domain-containing protein [Ruminococcaceae bacterium]|nr:methyltransferase domain-containing protein [Oscillospiraceae bacterium]
MTSPENFSYELINGKLKICTSNEHKFGTDAFLLSDFAQVKRKDRCVDLGTGCGIIPLLWFREPEDAPQVAYGVDIQPQAIQQMKLTVEACNLQERLIPVEGDLKDLSPQLPADSFTLVTCNPPYKATNTGILNEADAHTIARHEILCNINDVCRAAARLLKFGGRLCICQRPERLLDTLEAMRNNKIEPKRLRFVQKKGDTAPWLFLVEGKKGSAPYMKVEAPFLIQAKDSDENSDELRRVYRLI